MKENKYDFPEDAHPITIQASPFNYNFYRYNLPLANCRYCIHLSDIEADYDIFTLGIFDFKNNCKVKYINCSAHEEVYFSFETGNDIDQWALCIYAGIVGHTWNQVLHIRNFEVKKMPMKAVPVTGNEIGLQENAENV